MPTGSLDKWFVSDDDYDGEYHSDDEDDNKIYINTCDII